MTWLSRGIVQNGVLRIQWRRSIRDSPNYLSMQVYKRVSGNRWCRATDSVLRNHWIVMAQRRSGYLITSIQSTAIQLNRVSLIPGSDGRGCELRSDWQGVWSPDYFAMEMDRIRLAGSLQLMATLSIGVAILTGVAIGGAFGPFAGAMGIAAEGGAVVSVIVGAVSGALSTFIQRNFEAMSQAVRNDPANGAAHYYRSNQTSFTAIMFDTLLAGAFSGGTALIPAPSGVGSARDFAGVIANRMANAFAGIVQGVVGYILSPQRPQAISEQQARQQISDQFIQDLVIRCLG